MSGTRPWRAFSFLPSPARRILSRMPMQGSSLPVGPRGALACQCCRVSERMVDTVIFDVGGVLAENGRHSDFGTRFPAADVERVTKVLLGDYAEDGDHPWHR